MEGTEASKSCCGFQDWMPDRYTAQRCEILHTQCRGMTLCQINEFHAYVKRVLVQVLWHVDLSDSAPVESCEGQRITMGNCDMYHM